MPTPLIRKVRKGKGKTVNELGSLILRLVHAGYQKFEIEDLGDAILVRTWRVKRRENNDHMA